MSFLHRFVFYNTTLNAVDKRSFSSVWSDMIYVHPRNLARFFTAFLLWANLQITIP